MKPLTLPETHIRELSETGKTERRQVCDPQPEYDGKWYILGGCQWSSHESVKPYPNHSLATASPFGATGETYTVDDMQLLSTVTLERREQWEWVQRLEVVK